MWSKKRFSILKSTYKSALVRISIGLVSFFTPFSGRKQHLFSKMLQLLCVFLYLSFSLPFSKEIVLKCNNNKLTYAKNSPSLHFLEPCNAMMGHLHVVQKEAI